MTTIFNPSAAQVATLPIPLQDRIVFGSKLLNTLLVSNLEFDYHDVYSELTQQHYRTPMECTQYDFFQRIESPDWQVAVSFQYKDYDFPSNQGNLTNCYWARYPVVSVIRRVDDKLYTVLEMTITYDDVFDGNDCTIASNTVAIDTVRNT